MDTGASLGGSEKRFDGGEANRSTGVGGDTGTLVGVGLDGLPAWGFRILRRCSSSSIVRLLSAGASL